MGDSTSDAGECDAVGPPRLASPLPASLYPAVYLVFKDQRARQAFLTYLQHVIDGKVFNPALAPVLDRLEGSPVLIDVGFP